MLNRGFTKHYLATDGGQPRVICRTRTIFQRPAQCWKISCSASSTAARKFLTQFLAGIFLASCRKFLSSHIAISFTFCLQKRFASRDCLVLRLKFIIMCVCHNVVTIRHTYAGSFTFYIHRKFIFWDFAARREIYFLGLDLLPT